MKPIAVLASVFAALALAACGGGGKSESEKAQDTVCNARADISKQINTLKGLSVSTANLAQVESSLRAIDRDLQQITAAQGDLKGDRKREVQQANQEFVNQIKNIASTMTTAGSLSQAKQQATAALQQLATVYEQTFAKITCS
jgi:uncharacterized phage infection (PIP) family protein YhgE